MARLAALQPLLVGIVLAWSSYGKLFGRNLAERARRTALARVVGDDRAPAAFRAVGVVELSIGTALLLPPVWTAEVVAACLLAAGFVAYLGYVRVVAPESSCGCLGSAALPVSSRSIARAAMLLAATVLALTTRQGWWTVEPALVVVLAAELAVFVALSGELDLYWLLPLRRLRVRLTHPLAGTVSDEVPLGASVEQLQSGPAFRAVGAMLRSDVREHWDDGEWRFVSYTASYQGRTATAVFSVPKLKYDPDAVRVAIVDEERGETLFA